MTPSDLLSAAADRVRDLAAAASPGPWQDNGYGMLVAPEVDWRERGYDVAAGCQDGNRGWIAALSPAVAPALEEWLRATAKAVFVWEELDRPFTAAEEAAVRFAAAVCPDLVGEDKP